MREPVESLSDDDAALVRRILAGECGVFSSLMARHESVVFRFLWHRCGHRQDAEDLLQSTFLQAFRMLHRYDTTRPFEAWAITLARRLHADFFRARRRRSAREEVHGACAEQQCETDAAQRLMEEESKAALWAVVREHCSEETCDALHLAYQEGWSHDAIATALGCRPGRVKILLHRARTKLAPLLVEHTPNHFAPRVSAYFSTQGVSS
jgi:RNA polymerase sigma-70 factor, ECF subfamily